MKKTDVNYQEGLKQDLLNSKEAAAYLNAALEDGSQDVFLLALRDIAEAKGITALSRDAMLNRENIYRILSSRGNPQLSSLMALLESLDLKLTINVKNVDVA